MKTGLVGECFVLVAWCFAEEGIISFVRVTDVWCFVLFLFSFYGYNDCFLVCFYCVFGARSDIVVTLYGAIFCESGCQQSHRN
jgi:hypothetical protein